MDAVFKCFIQASKLYHANPSEENMEQVLRQFDVLMGQTSSATDLQFFNPRDLMVAECLMIMIDLLFDMKPKIIQKLFFLLANLGRCPELQESLCTQLHLHNSLAVFLQAYGTAEKDTLFLQCLKLLDTFTYHAVLHSLESPIEYLLNFIFKEIQSDFSESLIPCLGILSNMCRNSSAIISYIRSLPNYKRLLKDVLSKLDCTLQPVLIHTMIVLHRLTQGDSLSKMVFSEKNLGQAVEMVVKVCSTEDCSTHRAATDLLTILLTTPEYQKHLAQSNQLDSALSSIWSSLKNTRPASATNLLLLLDSVLTVPELSSKTVDCLMAQNSVHSILSLLSDWALRTNNYKLDMLSLRVLNSLFQEVLRQERGQDLIDFIDSVLSYAVTQRLDSILTSESSHLKLKVDKIHTILKLVSLLSRFKETRPLLKVLKAETLKEVVTHQISFFSISGDQDCNDASTEVVLLSLTIANNLGSICQEMKDVFLSSMKVSLKGDLVEEVLNFEPSPLHLADYFQGGLSSDTKDQVKRKGIPFHVGTWSKAEDHILKETFAQKYKIPCVSFLFGDTKRLETNVPEVLRKFLEVKKFTFQLGKGLPDRTLYSIYQRAKNQSRAVSVEEQKDGIRFCLQAKVGSKWSTVSEVTQRSSRTLLKAARWHQEQRELNDWSVEESTNLVEVLQRSFVFSPNGSLKPPSWSQVASQVPTRTQAECFQHCGVSQHSEQRGFAFSPTAEDSAAATFSGVSSAPSASVAKKHGQEETKNDSSSDSDSPDADFFLSKRSRDDDEVKRLWPENSRHKFYEYVQRTFVGTKRITKSNFNPDTSSSDDIVQISKPKNSNMRIENSDLEDSSSSPTNPVKARSVLARLKLNSNKKRAVGNKEQDPKLDNVQCLPDYDQDNPESSEDEFSFKKQSCNFLVRARLLFSLIYNC